MPTHAWFIFTSKGVMFTINDAENITKAVAAFRRCKHPQPGEIVGVIRGAAAMEIRGLTRSTPVFGVVCCVAENTTPNPPGK